MNHRFRMIIGFLALSILTPTFAADGEHKLELSFGSSMMYVTQSDLQKAKDKDNVVLPTSAILALGEYLQNSKIGYPVFINIPTAQHRFLENNELKYEPAFPMMAIGVRYSPWVWAPFKDSYLDVQLAQSIGVVFNYKDFSELSKPAPISSVRLHIWKKDGFAMYFGGAHTFFINAWTVFYGIGHRF